MKVLFLDIDGVVNCKSTTERFNGYIGIDPVLVERVKRIIEETGCSVVLSSTWRIREKDRQHVREKVCEFIDRTPNHSSLLTRSMRGGEVAEWLGQHPEVTRYAILDDDPDFYEDQPLFRTSFDIGITEETTQAVIDWLNYEK